jgi:hypothetical protein
VLRLAVILVLFAATMATMATGSRSAVPVASSLPPHGDSFHAELTARLTPAALTRRPSGVRPGARGTFRATFYRFNDVWTNARIWLRTSRLTGLALKAEIHSGAPGKAGPPLYPLCDRGRCGLVGTGMLLRPTAEFESLVRTLEVLGGYVVVRTKRNPHGELRGQIVIR